MKKLTLFICLNIPLTIVFAQDLVVPGYIPANPQAKSGWNMIFYDEFSAALSTLKWDNELKGFAECSRLFTPNPSNVSVSNGYIRFKVTDQVFNGCQYAGSSIRTFDEGNPSFKSINFTAPGYLEIRAKVPIHYGIGSAGWLYNCWAPQYSEIDVWENDGLYKFFQHTTYHWQKDDNGSCCGVSGSCSLRAIDGDKLKIKNQDDPAFPVGYHDLDLSSTYMVYGLEWTVDYIKWYLNNELVRELDLSQCPPSDQGSTYDRPTGKLNFILGAGPNSVGDSVNNGGDDLPDTLIVDYVRIYKKNGTKAGAVSGYAVRCPGQVNYLGATWFPDATYQWSSTAFDLTSPTSADITATLKAGKAYNQNYTITCTMSFPLGYQEVLNYNVYVSTSPPVAPSVTGLISRRITGTCYYELSKGKAYPEEGIQFSINNGPWVTGNDIVASGNGESNYGVFEPNTTLNVKLKSLNACGVSSASVQKTLTTGNPPSGCMYKMPGEDENDSLSAATSETISEELALVGAGTGANNLGAIPFKIQIHDMMGQLMFSDLAGDQLYTNNWSRYHLTQGLYIVSIKDKAGQLIEVQKIFIPK